MKGLAGYSDWRLPTLDEMKLLAQRIDTLGPLQRGHHTFWTATPDPHSSLVFQFDFERGEEVLEPVHELAEVRLVRPNDGQMDGNFGILLRDPEHGLAWMDPPLIGGFNYHHALRAADMANMGIHVENTHDGRERKPRYRGDSLSP